LATNQLIPLTLDLLHDPNPAKDREIKTGSSILVATPCSYFIGTPGRIRRPRF
jgi:hypothetical protein